MPLKARSDQSISPNGQKNEWVNGIPIPPKINCAFNRSEQSAACEIIREEGGSFIHEKAANHRLESVSPLLAS
jgi:hypothetical protein